MTSYVVTAVFVTAETNVGPGRAQVDFPRGADLPGDVPKEQIDRLLGLGLIVDEADYVKPAPPVIEPEPSEVPRPPQNAPKSDWVTYAVGHPDEDRRLSEEDAESLTKSQLIEFYTEN